MGLAYLYLLSRIMKFFSHLQNGQLIPCENERKFNLENKAQPRDFSTQIPLANLVMGQTPHHIIKHRSNSNIIFRTLNVFTRVSAIWSMLEFQSEPLICFIVW